MYYNITRHRFDTVGAKLSLHCENCHHNTRHEVTEPNKYPATQVVKCWFCGRFTWIIHVLDDGYSWQTSQKE